MISKQEKEIKIFSEKHWTLYKMKIKSSKTQKSKLSMYAVRPDTVMIIPFINDKEIILIKEYCPTHDKYMIFLPKGKIDEGENPKNAASRELQEEIFYKPDYLVQIGKLENDKIKSDTYVFIAKELEKSVLLGDEIEYSEVIKISFDKSIEMIKRGEITESRTVASLLMYKSFNI